MCITTVLPFLNCVSHKKQPSSLSMYYIKRIYEVLKLRFFKMLEKALHLLLLLLRSSCSVPGLSFSLQQYSEQHGSVRKNMDIKLPTHFC